MNRRNRRDREDEDSKEAEQAEEDRGMEEEEVAPLSDEDEGEDLDENAERDYDRIEELDQYEKESADDEEHSADQEARRQAEQQLEQRDLLRQKADRKRGQIDVDDYLGDELEYEMRMRERDMIFREDEDMEILEKDQKLLDSEEARGKLPQWIKKQSTIRYIHLRFSKFLMSYQGQANYPIYAAAIRDMCTNNRQSIEISYEHLKATNPTLSWWVAMEPLIIFPYLNMSAYKMALKNYPAFQKIHPEVFVKIKDIPINDDIRSLRFVHMNKLVNVTGVITKRSQVYSQLKKVAFKCYKCGQIKDDYYLNNFHDIKSLKLGQCSSCQSNGPFKIEKSRTVYRNHQIVMIQESPGDVPAGRIPRQKEVILLGDNIDVARPGDEVKLIGVYMNKYSVRLNAANGLPVFSTMIEANYIKRVEDASTQEAQINIEQLTKKMSRDPKFTEKLLNSIAPNIYGHEQTKMALALAMFGGVEKVVEETHRVRGDINVLIMGDPGTAKSQLLKSIQKVFHRSIYTTGKGASAVGLTASVKRDFSTGQWMLEAGALVLADKGICLIDEFDKMNEKDRTSIHEAMEQQSISISKAGIVATLRARCTVIAAANPIEGRYNMQKSFKQNVDLTDPILSRFDILCVVRDEFDERIDHDLSTFVINQHMKNHPISHKLMDRPLEERTQDIEKFSHDDVKRYIKYARDHVRPQLTSSNTEMIKQFYLELREEAKATGGINIAVRHIESVIRMATAHAKMHLRTEVTKQDVEEARRVMLKSFIKTQRFSVQQILYRKFKKYL